MKRRGILVRDELRFAIDENSIAIAQAMKLEGIEDLIIEGRDGTGQKSKVPWTRFGSKSRAPNAQSGWYCVFLFRPQADGVYICLSHGSTIWSGADYITRPDSEIIPLMSWGHKILQEEIVENELLTLIDLKSVNTLARAYEKSTLLAKFYEVGNLPTNEEIMDDLLLFSKMLSEIYSLEDIGRGPNEFTNLQEVAQKQIKDFENGTAVVSNGQGYGLTPPQRKAVELRAMEVAKNWLKENGFSVKDVSATKPCDYHAFKNKEKFYVEVKGTTGQGEAVILTKNEVDLHSSVYPNNILMIISLINLEELTSKVKVSGGVLKVIMPWLVEENDLTALSFQYKVRELS